MLLNPADFEYVRELVARRAALVLTPEKNYFAQSRLLVLARKEGLKSPSGLIARVRAEPDADLSQKVVEAMAVNETSFFRDVLAFEALRKQIVPRLVKDRAAARRLFIWCGACSTGQEPYSLALLLREHFPELKSWDVRILATDLSGEAVARAREGLYTQLEVNRGLPAAMLVKYFRGQGAQWLLQDGILAMVEFQQLNLNDAWPKMPSADLILLRNVLVHFDAATRTKVLQKARPLLARDGYLMLGSAESVEDLDEGYERHSLGGAHYFKIKSLRNGTATSDAPLYAGR